MCIQIVSIVQWCLVIPSWWVFDLKCQDGCKNSIEKFESFGREKFGGGDFWSFDIVMGK